MLGMEWLGEIGQSSIIYHHRGDTPGGKMIDRWASEGEREGGREDKTNGWTKVNNAFD